MDISKASNFERFLFDLVWRDPAITRELMQKVQDDGGFDLAACDKLWSRVPGFGFVSHKSTHADRVARIRSTWQQYQVEIDPHTADGINAAAAVAAGDLPVICLETALPAKFAAIVQEALGRAPNRPPAFDGIENVPQRFAVITTSVERLKEAVAKACQVE
jgi:threonine synthase